MKSVVFSISADTFHSSCDILAASDPGLQNIIKTYGYPPFWSRPNSFETLVHIILEQQVSLASALAALENLRQLVGDITPYNVSQLSDEQLKSAYFSRQKISYIRSLALSLQSKELDLQTLPGLSDDRVRQTLLRQKGIGNWTVDIYLIMVLHRPDVFATTDLAAIKSLRKIKNSTSAQDVSNSIDTFRPYRSVATMLLWHDYLSSKQHG